MTIEMISTQEVLQMLMARSHKLSSEAKRYARLKELSQETPELSEDLQFLLSLDRMSLFYRLRDIQSEELTFAAEPMFRELSNRYPALCLIYLAGGDGYIPDNSQLQALQHHTQTHHCFLLDGGASELLLGVYNSRMQKLLSPDAFVHLMGNKG